jgi:WhiB family transcriptional regulator, redox-sensing transcriptional regulator
MNQDELATRTTVTRGTWRAAAACRSVDPELFFPISDSAKSREQAAEAKAICSVCPVQRECLAFAMRTWQVHGIWGGTTVAERVITRRTRPALGHDHDGYR